MSNIKFIIIPFAILLLITPVTAKENEDINIEVWTLKRIMEEELSKIEIEKQLIEEMIEKQKNKPPEVSRGMVKEVPNTDTSMKTYMDYRTITDKTSEQYKLQQREDVYTDDEGLRRIGDRYMIAIGSFYSKTIGDVLKIKLSGGTIFEGVVSDFKADKHTDSKNQVHKVDKSLVEFIVDVDKLADLPRKMGDMSYAEGINLKGNIVSIEVLGNINE